MRCCDVPVSKFMRTWESINFTRCYRCELKYNRATLPSTIKHRKKLIKVRQTWINHIDNNQGFFQTITQDNQRMMFRNAYRNEIAFYNKQIKQLVRNINLINQKLKEDNQ